MDCIRRGQKGKILVSFTVEIERQASQGREVRGEEQGLRPRVTTSFFPREAGLAPAVIPTNERRPCPTPLRAQPALAKGWLATGARLARGSPFLNSALRTSS